ncbi:competence type IV pilus minor pilin ComGF [Aeribacillus alveayuensis]|uniref:Competence protein ComGF n=1 Tax=Aeribacillus alveayuensis TaxID=279215 RepID=A0ABT9VK68_9BACI|nr:competence protein ComGF [Bacillus alveayuensis]
MRRTKTKFVAILYRNRGFTFANLLISFSIALLILFSFNVLLSYFLKTSVHSKDLHPYEWKVFLITLQKDLKNANQLQVRSNIITYEDIKGRNIMISQYGNVIRYQVEGQGHIVMLQRVKTSHFQQVQHGVSIEIESLKGSFYDAIIRDYKGLVKREE